MGSLISEWSMTGAVAPINWLHPVPRCVCRVSSSTSLFHIREGHRSSTALRWIQPEMHKSVLDLHSIEGLSFQPRSECSLLSSEMLGVVCKYVPCKCTNVVRMELNLSVPWLLPQPLLTTLQKGKSPFLSQ